MTKRFGFTLAEVLITLGIIGVVAAMTMPTLINQTNGAQYKAAYKKALSAISQGVTLNVALDDISFADATEPSAAANVTATKDKTIAGFLQNRMNVVKTSEGVQSYKIDGADFGANNVTLYFNDSSAFSFPISGSDPKIAKECTEASPCKGLIDVNGQKGPNKKVTKTNGVVNVTDVYPVIFYDQTILPSTEAAKEVLYGK